MRKTMREAMLLVGVAAFGLLTAPAFAEEADKPTANATVGLFSKYVWRGEELSHDSLVIQPSLTVGYKGFSANVWNNADTHVDERLKALSNDTSKGNFDMNETDFTLAYDWSVGKLGFSAGYIYYNLELAEDTQEVFLKSSVDTFLKPTITVYRDIAGTPYWYVTGAISHSLPIKKDISLDLGAQVSYWAYDHAVDGPDANDPGKAFSAFHDGLLSASVTLPVNKYVSVTPQLYYSFPLSADASDRLKALNVASSDDSFVYGGVSVGLSF
ncbi:MAG: hypothetical protein M0017_09980 [Desulfobacteraceae bacterium]|nr:hypothetical protein [Desulfobacteraceae bacterium]